MVSLLLLLLLVLVPLMLMMMISHRFQLRAPTLLKSFPLFCFFRKTKRRNRQLKEKEIEEEEEETVGGWAWISFQGRGDAEGDKELKSPHTFLHVWKVCTRAAYLLRGSGPCRVRWVELHHGTLVFDLMIRTRSDTLQDAKGGFGIFRIGCSVGPRLDE